MKYTPTSCFSWYIENGYDKQLRLVLHLSIEVLPLIRHWDFNLVSGANSVGVPAV